MLKHIALGIVLLGGLLAGLAWADEALNDELFIAVEYRDITTVEALISKGADVNAKGFYSTPLNTAALLGKSEVAQLLISKGASINNKDVDGRTPLDNAALKGKKAVVELLIAMGADVNVEDHYGNTTLGWALYGGNNEVVALLISNGADVNKKDRVFGKTPLDLAVEKNNTNAISLLRTAMRKQDEVAALLRAALQGKPSNQRGAFNHVMANYKGCTMIDEIRRPFITLATKLRPAPTVSEEARKYLIRGNALLQDAKSPGEARTAIQEYQNALQAAPWWDDAYYNLSKAQELAGDFDGAISSMQYYLLTEPRDKRDAQDRLYALEAKRDKKGGK